jgi:hypothetical protein
MSGGCLQMKPSHLFLLTFIAINLLFPACTKTVRDIRARPVTDSPDSREFFACLVNGIGFVSEASTGNVSGSCSYGAKYRGSAGRSFQIVSDYHVSVCKTVTIGVTLDSIELVEGQTYVLGAPGNRKNFGIYLHSECSQSRVDLFTNDSTQPAHITITRLDTVKRVVTGTFRFVVQDEFGAKYQISDGIFDRHFTK